MHCHCGTNNRAPQWTFTDPCKPEVRPGAREESASPAWLAAPAMKYKMVFSLDRLKGLIQICVSMRVTSLNCTEHSLFLY